MKKSIIKKENKYNQLTAIKFDHRDKHNNLYWLFKCDCGNNKIIRVNSVIRGITKSCGCLYKSMKNAHRTHFMSKSPEYKVWENFIQKCNNPNNYYYEKNKKQKIKICNRWNRFENFYKDMGEKPEGYKFIRIDNEKDYCKENGKWIKINKKR